MTDQQIILKFMGWTDLHSNCGNNPVDCHENYPELTLDYVHEVEVELYEMLRVISAPLEVRVKALVEVIKEIK